MIRIHLLAILLTTSIVTFAQTTKERLIAYSYFYLAGPSTFHVDSTTYQYTSSNGGIMTGNANGLLYVGKYDLNNKWLQSSSGYYNAYASGRAYDVHDNIIIDSTSRYDTLTAVWYSVQKNIFTYDISNNNTSNTLQTWDTSTSMHFWKNSNKDTYVYVGTDMVSDTTYTWDMSANKWDYASLLINTYNSHHDLTTQTSYAWSTSAGTWQPYNRIYTYINLAGNIDSTLQQTYNTTSSIWENGRRNVFTYDLSGKMIADTSKYWSMALSKWNNSALDTFEYSGTDIISHTEMRLGISTWTRFMRYLYTTDAYHNRTTQTTLYWNSGSYQNIAKDSTAYDTYHQMTFITTLTWDSFAWIFAPGNYQNKFYYQTYTPTSIENTSGSVGTCKLYPNPATDIMNIDLRFKDKKSAIIGVYDMAGKLYMQWQTENTDIYLHQLNVRSLPQGNYFLRILSDKDKLVEQFSVVR